MEKLNEYVSIVPSSIQYDLQKMGFYAFIHFGMNTFLDKEWSDGTASPELFNPTDLDTDSWCDAICSAGMKGIILTAKHHDGFCLWQTATTEYSIKNSPYKNGKGDIVRELRDSCDKFGLKLGIYLSPWDRNSKYYSTDKYNDFYISQLTELLTNYGDIFEVWLDGACGSHLDGKPMQKYDFPRIYSEIRRLQPNCIISNCGPDVRWIGNEGGLTRKSEWNVLPDLATDTSKIMEASQQNDNGVIYFDQVEEDLGSRKILENHDRFVWYPAEVDVSIRPGWFYHSSEDNKLRSVNDLLNIYYSSVGGNAMLLLNIPPDKTGRIHPNDRARLEELGNRIRSGLSTEVPIRAIHGSQEKKEFPISNLRRGKTYSPELSDKYVISLELKEISKIDKVMLVEDVHFSQRIERFEVYIKYRGRVRKVYNGTTVGMCKIALFPKWTYAEEVMIVIDSCRLEPYIEKIAVYESDEKLPKPHLFRRSIKKLASQIGYKIYVANANKKKKKQTTQNTK